MFVELIATVSLDERFVYADASLVTPVAVDLSSRSTILTPCQPARLTKEYTYSKLPLFHHEVQG